ncbi:unnamed protein product [Arctia plantaginis]|uniref:Uncharacterized protein n=1 Tax=Arctia plantaginis TaxID=874455 RepID=A0A8S1A5R0_ARCPL|nr:unnamed protein product [Arctia plantaginis]
MYPSRLGGRDTRRFSRYSETKFTIVKIKEFLFINFKVIDLPTKMSESKQLQAGQQLVKKTMDELIEQRKTTEKVSIEARQEFREHFQSSYEEEFEEETFIDEHGNETTKRVESSSESSEHSKSGSADARLKGCKLNVSALFRVCGGLKE